VSAKIQQKLDSARVFRNKNREIFNWLNSNILKFSRKSKKEELSFFLTTKNTKLKAQRPQNLKKTCRYSVDNKFHYG